MNLDVKKILVLLAEREMSQADLAQKCGMKRQGLYEILKRSYCTTKTAGRIANGMDVPVTEILKEE